MTTRADMAQGLALSSVSPTKTYVVEAHVDDPAACLTELPGRLEPTEDAFLFRLATAEGVYWVDQLDERFWRFHTDMRNADALPMLREWVGGRRDLDWMWLPSEHLRHVWPNAASRRVRTDFRGGGFVGGNAPARDMRVQLFGENAERLLDLISEIPEYSSAVSFEGVEAEIADPSFGRVREGVSRMGRFAVSGDSLELHLQFVNTVVDRYKQLVELVEAQAINWQRASEDGGGIVNGAPIVVTFSREIEDVGAFADELTSSREPFRLWGLTTVKRDVAEVEAVDLHVGQTLQMDIARRWMRIYLSAGSCGNTVARLISNLQHRFDGALSLRDPKIDVAARRPLAAGA
ncbi:hypothetical protein Psuf_022070 [Phytohabitans suffuscus]|uniref:Uncharacterized protein n=1 Tax=Phytohabitans suffuscus TaxID=624315 RepID=A0A6F8YFH6_9ACTN|nr:hypothetical protein Psuf_022070 [Phytohabitans suffuscus]